MDLTVTYVGNATTLISAGDVTLLTDPNFLHRGQRAYLGYGLVSKRRHDPALDVEDLPPLDAVVLSHMHGDHWDRVAEARLDHDLPVLTTPQAARRLLRRGFVRSVPLSTWRHHEIVKGDVSVSVTALPGRHAPPPFDRFLPSVMGSMITCTGQDGSARRIWISGDTLLIDELAEIPRRFDSIDAGIVHLGGTRLPFGRRGPFGLTVTMDGQQGAGAIERVRPGKVIPVHFDDYGVFASPLSEFLDEMRRRGKADQVIELARGASVTL